MSEGKSIMNHFLSVLVAAIMFGALSYIIVINTDIWNVSAQQSEASGSLMDYSKYAAYDQTNCRGQDILTLVSKSSGEPFVIITDGSNVLAASYDSYTKDLELQNLDISTAVSSVLNHTGGTKVSDLVAMSGGIVWDYSVASPNNQALQNFFLNGAGTSTPGKYSSYSTYLIYDNSLSTSVIGIVAVREG